MVFRRKNIRLPAENYLGKRSYFITICCYRRRQVFVEARVVDWLLAQLRRWADGYGFAVHAYCLMPDHVHLLLEGLRLDCSLLKFVNLFKQRTAFEYEKNHSRPLWQYNFYDHILRRNDEADAVAWYIWMNPVRKELCARAEDYPFSGSFTVEWKRKDRPNREWVPPWRKPL